jgi:undecaprenyl-diphosphatase
MIETILELDSQLFLFLNGMGSDAMDAFWLLITKKFMWIPVFTVILYLLVRHLGWKHVILVSVLVALLLTFTDQTTNLVKNFFQRARPVNNADLAALIRAVQRGGSYSFFSGHASNSMAVAVFLFLILRRYIKYMGLLFIWPLIFAYSRIYLGLHYPLDIFCGYLYGAITGLLMFQLYRFARNRIFPEKENLDYPTNA